MRRKKIIILPKLYDAGGDIDKKWFVYFSIRNPRTGKMVRFKYFDDLGKSNQTKKARYAIASEKIEVLTRKIKKGWTPLDNVDAKAIYDDSLVYKGVADIFGTKKSRNKTFNYFANEYMNFIRNSIREDTVSTYNSKLRIFDQWLHKHYLGDVDVSSISQPEILKFFTYLIEGRQLSGHSIRKYTQLIKGVFDFVKHKGCIPGNPVYDLPPCNRINDQSPSPIHDMDIDILINEVKRRNPQLFLVICFEYYCFLRPGKEIRLMRAKWIDWGLGLITIPAEVSKNKREKRVTIPYPFMNILRTRNLHRTPPNLYLFGKDGPSSTPVGKNYFRNKFSAIRKDLEMPDNYKLYSWKHTGNIKAFESGISQYDLMNQNGHSSLEITSKYLRKRVVKVSEQIQENFPKL